MISFVKLQGEILGKEGCLEAKILAGEANRDVGGPPIVRSNIEI
jgi:hypothetical protein